MKKNTSVPSSLFVGRWQPFHKGHQVLIETVLKKGKPVVVAIRDTEISHKNPYTVFERWTMIQKVLKKYGELVKIVVIPDIDEICYGREVGYDIRKIGLKAEIEDISGTKTRAQNPPNQKIIWLTGQSGSGKTTIANALQREIGGTVLDGDEMRETISQGLGFSKQDREIHNLRVARLAQTLSKRTPVIVSVIAPFAEARHKINHLIKPIWIYIKRNLPNHKDKPYEEPLNPNLVIDSDKYSVKESIEQILKLLEKDKSI